MNKKDREPAQGGYEHDVFSGWRKVLKCCERAGYKRYAKKKFNKRVRKNAKRDIQG